MKVYVSGALKGSRNLVAARALYELAAATIADAGYEPYLPHKNTDPEATPEISAERVFATDVEAIRNSDAVLAFLNEPSLGVGAEVAICSQESIPILGLCERGVDVSRFTVGCLTAGNGRFIRYAAWDQVQNAILGFLDELRSRAS